MLRAWFLSQTAEIANSISHRTLAFQLATALSVCFSICFLSFSTADVPLFQPYCYYQYISFHHTFYIVFARIFVYDLFFFVFNFRFFILSFSPEEQMNWLNTWQRVEFLARCPEWHRATLLAASVALCYRQRTWGHASAALAERLPASAKSRSHFGSSVARVKSGAPLMRLSGSVAAVLLLVDASVYPRDRSTPPWARR